MLYDTDKLTPVTEENILKRTTEYDIYSYYIGRKVPINTKFNSPLRKDDDPSFGLFMAKKTRSLLFKDQGTGIVGNCFKFVQLYKQLATYRDALNKINKDLSLGLLERSQKGLLVRDKYKPSRTKIAVKKRNFTKFDLDYWSQFCITRETLRKFNIFPISKLWINDAVSKYFYSKREPMYAYRIYNKFKIYRPHSSKDNKFLNNCNKHDIQGFQQLKKSGELVIVTKSLKDVMVLYELDFSSIAANSESTPIPKDVMLDLKKRFNRVVVLYDNDSTGVKGMIDMKKAYNLKCIFIPLGYRAKDISDLIKKVGFNKTYTILNKLLYG